MAANKINMNGHSYEDKFIIFLGLNLLYFSEKISFSLTPSKQRGLEVKSYYKALVLE